MPTAAEILGGFESLGDNCELGIAQRFAGIEPLGLFRLNFATLPALLRALDSDFAGIDGPGDLELMVEPDREYRVRVRGYDFMYHTERYVGQVAPDVLLAQQVVAVRFLVRKLRADLAAAEKIFVRKGEDSRREPDIEALHRALRRHGPATLLWVVPEDRERRRGTVEVLRDGLLRGFIDRFAPLDDVHSLSAAWYEVCRNARALWLGGCLPGSVLARDAAAVANLLPGSDSFAGPGWRAGVAATGTQSGEVPRLRPDAEVLAHTLHWDTSRDYQDVHFHYVPAGLIAGDIYTGSIHVWLPEGFAGTEVGVAFGGLAPIDARPADPRARGGWQRVSVAARISDAQASADLALRLRGPAGCRIFSTCWQLERGGIPGRYAPGPGAAPA
jgi:hypothetical protein